MFACLFKPLTREAGCFGDRHPHTILEAWDMLMGHPAEWVKTAAAIITSTPSGNSIWEIFGR
jgi:hypothetical protein